MGQVPPESIMGIVAGITILCNYFFWGYVRNMNKELKDDLRILKKKHATKILVKYSTKKRFGGGSIKVEADQEGIESLINTIGSSNYTFDIIKVTE